MKETLIQQPTLEQKALDIVSGLKKAALEKTRTYPPLVDAVLVFGGPGTYYDRLKPDQEEWMRWMDRDRIRSGVGLVRELTASTKNFHLSSDSYGNKNIKTKDITKKDIIGFGPVFVYNGIPLENTILCKALDSPYSKLPQNKVVVIDKVQHEGKIVPIIHTGDQVQSFYEELSNPDSLIYGATRIALVSHIPHFVRIPFYIAKYEQEIGHLLSCEREYFAYGLKGRPGVEEKFIEYEMAKLPVYAQLGHLSNDPIPLKF